MTKEAAWRSAVLVGSTVTVGEYREKNHGEVKDHNFRSEAVGMAIPYGVYVVQDNSGAVVVGTSHETSEFAVASLAKWWRYQGRMRYPGARNLLVLADTGGGNAANRHARKYFLQWGFCNKYGISVTVSHYPSGASKWNPVEHRLFSEISKNWRGRPLDSYQTCLNYIATSRTSTGLKVRAYLDSMQYEKGIEISKTELEFLRLKRDDTPRKCNYTLRPH